MKMMRKILIGTLAAVSVLAVSAGLVGCGDDTPTTTTPATTEPVGEKVEYEGGYWYSLMVTGGVDYGVGVNLYEDGTYYAISTQVTFSGTYTATEATGTVTIDGKEYDKCYTITLSDDPFTESPNGVYTGYDEHLVISDGEGNILLTDIVDGPSSQALYNLAKQEDYIEETITILSTYYSESYATDYIKVELYSDDTYVLDGINGAGEAGSIGTYASSSADGVTTCTLKDDSGEKEYTLAVGETITLSDGAKEYPMSDSDSTQEAQVQLTLSGTPASGTVTAKLELYDDGSWVLLLYYWDGDPGNESAGGTWATDALYNNVLTVTDDSGDIFSEDTYTLTVDYTTFQYSGTITLVLPAGMGTVEYTFAQV